MRVEIHQGVVASKVVIGSIKAKISISDGGVRHVNAVNNPLEKRGGALIR